MSGTAAGEAPPAPPLWCRKCGLPAVLARGEGEYGKVVHQASGSERGGDGHYAAAIEYETPVMADARDLRAEYAGYVEIDLLFGSAISARSLNPDELRSFDDTTADGMRAKLNLFLPAEAVLAAAGRREAREAAAR